MCVVRGFFRTVIQNSNPSISMSAPEAAKRTIDDVHAGATECAAEKKHKAEPCRVTSSFIPYLTVRDAKASVKLYQDAFGLEWKNQAEQGADEPLTHVEMKFKEQDVMFSVEGAFGSTKKSPKSLGIECPINLYFYCDDVDALWERASKVEGVTAALAPNDAFWGDRMCMLKDLDDYEWTFAKHL